MIRSYTRLLALALTGATGLVGSSNGAAQTPNPQIVTLKAADGVALKAAYFSPGRPGPGILLLHQCNRERSSWMQLATQAVGRGFHVLALDYRGFGESEGDRPADLQQQQRIVTEKWPGDIDGAFAWLQAQTGVDRNRIGAAGASCGVNQSVLLASRHPEIRTVVLLSGPVTPAGREYLRTSPSLPIFASASRDDGDTVNSMRWLLGWSRNPHNTFVEFQAAGHGTDMFAVEKTLEPSILQWFDTHLVRASTSAPASAAPSTPTAVEEFWTALTTPGGPSRARQLYEELKRRHPDTVLFPESEANAYGYQLLQEGNAKDAVAVFQLNVEVYPRSANTYDSLSDGYVALGNKTEALRYAEKALQMLDTDTQIPEQLRTAIRESAEKKVRELRPR